MTKAQKGTSPPPAKPHRKRRKRLYTGAATQAAVALGAMAGKSKSQIARETNLDRRTVTRILTQSEIADRINKARSIIGESLEDAANLYAKAIRDGDLGAAGDVLKGLQAFIPKGEQAVTMNDPDEERSRADKEFFTAHHHWPEEECRCSHIMLPTEYTDDLKRRFGTPDAFKPKAGR